MTQNPFDHVSLPTFDETIVSGQWAVRAADAGEAEVQVAAAEKPAGDVADDRPPRSVTRGVTLVVGALELGQASFDRAIEGRGARLARAIDGGGSGGQTTAHGAFEMGTQLVLTGRGPCGGFPARQGEQA